MSFFSLNRKRGGTGAAAGFTLVEIIAILVVVSILAVMVLVRIPDLEEHSRLIEINTLKSHLRYAQAMAMSTEKIWGIGFDDPSTYRLIEEGANSDLELPGADISDSSHNPDKDPRTVNLMELKIVSIAPGDSSVSFDASGTPVDSAGVAVTETISIREAGGSELFTVTPVTGFIE